MIQLISSGKLISFLWAVVVIIAIAYFSNQGRKGIGRIIQPMAALEGINIAIGRAAEMNRPVHLSIGRGELRRAETPMILAGLEVCIYSAELCAKMGAPIIFTLSEPALIPIIEERLKTAYEKAGAQELFETNTNIVYSPRDVLPMTIFETLQDAQVGASVWVGYFGYESVFVAEKGAEVGAMQIAGTNAAGSVAFMIGSCDYTFICNEVFAAGAYLSGDPIATSNVYAEDIVKILLLVFLGLTFILANVGFDILSILKL